MSFAQKEGRGRWGTRKGKERGIESIIFVFIGKR